MKIKKDCIGFRSTPEFWEKEFGGKKPHIERVLSRGEWDKLWEAFEVGDVHVIEIENTKTGEMFRREISDVSSLGELLGHHLITISWY